MAPNFISNTKPQTLRPLDPQGETHRRLHLPEAALRLSESVRVVSQPNSPKGRADPWR